MYMHITLSLSLMYIALCTVQSPRNEPVLSFFLRSARISSATVAVLHLLPVFRLRVRDGALQVSVFGNTRPQAQQTTTSHHEAVCWPWYCASFPVWQCSPPLYVDCVLASDVSRQGWRERKTSVMHLICQGCYIFRCRQIQIDLSDCVKRGF